MFSPVRRFQDAYQQCLQSTVGTQEALPYYTAHDVANGEISRLGAAFYNLVDTALLAATFPDSYWRAGWAGLVAMTEGRGDSPERDQVESDS